MTDNYCLKGEEIFQIQTDLVKKNMLEMQMGLLATFVQRDLVEFVVYHLVQSYYFVDRKQFYLLRILHCFYCSSSPGSDELSQQLIESGKHMLELIDTVSSIDTYFLDGMTSYIFSAMMYEF